MGYWMKNVILIFFIFIQMGCAGDSYYYSGNKKVVLTPNTTMTKSVSRVDFYQDENGVLLGVSDKLIVKVEEEVVIDDYLNEYNLTLESTLGPNTYLLKTTNKDLTLDVANRLSEKENVLYAHPDFLKKRISR
jgi:hypothetical protein